MRDADPSIRRLERDAMIFAFTPPAIIQLGTANGFDFQLVDRAGQGHAKLMEARGKLLGMASQNPALVGTRPNGLDDKAVDLRVDDHDNPLAELARILAKQVRRPER